MDESEPIGEGPPVRTGPVLDSGQPIWALYRAAVAYLDRPQRRRVARAGVSVAVVSVLDLVGVLLVGWMAGAAFARVQGIGTLRIPLIGRVADTTLIALGALGVALLLLRSVVAWLVNRRTLHFLAGCEADLATGFLDRVQRAPFELISTLTTQAVIEGVRGGARALVTVIMNCLLAFAEFALIALMAVFLVFVDPLLFVMVCLVFAGTFVLHARVATPRIHRFNAEFAVAAVDVNEVVGEVMGLAREERLYGTGQRSRSLLRAADSRYARRAADAQAWFQFPRYVLELALVLSMIAMAISVALRGGSPRVVAATTIFVVASGRILPSLLRLQSANSAIAAAVGQSSPTRRLLELPMEADRWAIGDEDGTSTVLSPPGIRLSGVCYRYPTSSHDVLHDIDLSVPAGRRTALVGSTGAGKSTLGDLLLGLLQPSAGSIEWTADDGVSLRPAFVAQDVYLTTRTIAENVAVGVDPDDIDEDRVWSALRSARVDDVVRALPDGIWSAVGERGARVSGGQRQRLGIARALYRDPSLLVLDEATSSLDASTESEIGEVLDDLHGRVTIIVIAHRLATVRHADMVVVLEKGRLVATGSFDEVLERVPDFARNAHLQGIV